MGAVRAIAAQVGALERVGPSGEGLDHRAVRERAAHAWDRRWLDIGCDHQRYMVTPLGRRVGVLFVKTYGCVLTLGLMALGPDLAAEFASRGVLMLAWR